MTTSAITDNYARLQDDDSLDEEPQDLEEKAGSGDPFMVANVLKAPVARSNMNLKEAVGNTRVVPIPISGGQWPALQIPFPFTETQWDEMIEMLTAMKKGIIQMPQGHASESYTRKDEPQEEA